MSSAMIPLLTADLLFFESVVGSLQLFSRDFWNFFRLFHIGTLMFHVGFGLFLVASIFVSHIDRHHAAFCEILQRHWLFLMQ